MVSNGLELTENRDEGILTVQVNYKKVHSSLPVISSLQKKSRLLSAFEAGYQRLVEKEGKPDLIHLNVVMPMGIGVEYLSKKYNLPYVINENWSGYCAEDGNYKGLAQTYFTKRIVKGARALMPTSTYLRDAMQSHNLDGNYQVIPNVVNTHVFKPLDHLPHTGTRLIHVSSLNDREKNVSGLIRAFAKASETVPGLYIEIVGEGVDKEKYLQLVKELNIQSKVLFLGRLFSQDLVKVVNAADALIMFSHFETFCLVIIEAFACGKPVITSSAGAIKSYMQPFLGLMVPTRDETALSQAIVKFAGTKENYDSQKIRQYAVDHYSYEKVGADLNRIYRKALD